MLHIVALSLLMILAVSADRAVAQRSSNDAFRKAVREFMMGAEGAMAIMPATHLIGHPDILRITLNQDGQPAAFIVVVKPSGTVYLPLLDDVPAAGLTADELRDVLAAKLKEFIRDPNPSVIVYDQRSARP